MLEPEGIPSLILAFSIILPLVGSVAVTLPGLAKFRNPLVIAVPLGTLFLILGLYPGLAAGQQPALALGGFASPLGFRLSVDHLSLAAAALTALLWFVASLYSLDYMSHENNQTRFFCFSLLSLVGTLGVFLAGDLITLLLFFELMTFSSYVLVIHKGDQAAISASRLYLFLGVLSGLLLLLGISLLAAMGAPLILRPGESLLQNYPLLQYLVAAMLILGFGIKAGMVPVHIWLPDAHPVAPTPASALLSGIMIKAGAYGIFRTLALFFPGSPAGDWVTAINLGFALTWVGIITMFLGVTMALLQENMKRMLACHSISQMGYILVGLGLAAYLGQEGAVGLAGGIYHIVNHALFKGALFLTAGMVYLKTHDLNMYNLGGLGRSLPFTALVALVAALGISGFPGLNGFASKTLIHHALVEAAHHGHFSLVLAEKIFVITGAGTAASMLKLIFFTYLGSPRKHTAVQSGESWPAKIGMGTLALALVIIGLKPNLLLERILVPAMVSFPYLWEVVEHELIHTHFWSWHNFQDAGISLLLGVGIFILGVRAGLFHLHPPRWFSLQYLGTSALKGFIHEGKLVWQGLASIQDRWNHRTHLLFKQLRIVLFRIDSHPGQSPLYNRICIGNISFDTLIVIVFLALMLFLYTPTVILAGGF